jgi:hypothetical protein
MTLALECHQENDLQPTYCIMSQSLTLTIVDKPNSSSISHTQNNLCAGDCCCRCVCCTIIQPRLQSRMSKEREKEKSEKVPDRGIVLGF